MKITVETETGFVERTFSDDADVDECLEYFADCLAGVGYAKYEFQIKEKECNCEND